MAIQIQYRNDTAANWTSANPVLLAGEIGYETDTGKMKIGDGSTAWTLLAYGPNLTSTTITGGTINGTTIGATSPSTGAFTTLTATSLTATSLTATGIDGTPIGATTPSTGAFTTATATTLTATVGAGFQNMVVLTGSGTWNLPSELQVLGSKFKYTIIGGGGGGGGTAAAAGQTGGGGGSGGVGIGFLSYASGVNTATYAAGTSGAGAAAGGSGGAGGTTTLTYNSSNYTAGGGGGGQVGSGTSSTGGAGGTAGVGTLSFTGNQGAFGGVATANRNTFADGGSTPLGYGFGGRTPLTQNTSRVGQGYGAGGSGAYNGTVAAATAGGAGTIGLIIIEY